MKWKLLLYLTFYFVNESTQRPLPQLVADFKRRKEGLQVRGYTCSEPEVFVWIPKKQDYVSAGNLETVLNKYLRKS